MTTRRLMIMSVFCAILFSLWVSMQNHLVAWEFRRAQLSRQRDVTQEVLSAFLNSGDRKSIEGDSEVNAFLTSLRTSDWSIAARSSRHDGNRLGPERIKIAGRNGRFRLEPIRIEIHDPVLHGTLTEKLEHAYSHNGWDCEIVSVAKAITPGPAAAC